MEEFFARAAREKARQDVAGRDGTATGRSSELPATDRPRPATPVGPPAPSDPEHWDTYDPHFDLLDAVSANVLWKLGNWYGDADAGREDGAAQEGDEGTEVLRHRASALAEVPDLKSGQSLVLELPSLPLRNLALRVAFRSFYVLHAGHSRPWQMPAPAAASPAGETAPIPDEDTAWEGEFVAITFNEQVLWSRWRLGSEGIATVLLPASLLRNGETGNVLMVENASSAELLIDAMWIEETSPAGPVFVGLADAGWITSPQLTKWLPMIVDRHGGPELDSGLPLSGIHGREIPHSGLPLSGIHGRDAPTAAPAVPLRGGLTAIPKQLCELRPDAVVATSPFRPEPEDASSAPDTHSGPDVYGREQQHSGPDVHGREQQHSGPDVHGREVLHTAPAVPLRGGIAAISKQLCELRATLVEHGAHAAALTTPWADCRRLAGMRSAREHARAAYEVAESVVAWFDAGGGPVLLDGGAAGDGLFPQGQARPAASWLLLRHLTAFGAGPARRIPCNIVPTTGRFGTTHTRVVAVQNGPQRVSVLAFAGDDQGRELRITVPVPWTDSETDIQIDGVRLSYRNAPEELEQETLTCPTDKHSGLPLSGIHGREQTRGRGRPRHYATVTFEYRSATFFVAKLSPQGADSQAPVRQTPATPAASPIVYRKDLFRLVDPLGVDAPWVEDIRRPHDLCVPLGPDVRTAVRPATLRRIGDSNNMAPWGRDSLFATFDSPASRSGSPAPIGLELRLGSDAYPHAKELRLWVCPTSTPAAKSVTLFAGSRKVSGSIKLRPKGWHCIAADWDALFPDRSVPPYFCIWPHPSLPEYKKNGSVTFELNGIVALGTHTPDGRDASGQVLCRRLDSGKESSDMMHYVLLGQTGRPLWREIRMADPIRIEDVQSTGNAIDWSYAPQTRALRIAFREPPEPYKDLDWWQRRLSRREYTLCANGAATPVGITIKTR